MNASKFTSIFTNIHYILHIEKNLNKNIEQAQNMAVILKNHLKYDLS